MEDRGDMMMVVEVFVGGKEMFFRPCFTLLEVALASYDIFDGLDLPTLSLDIDLLLDLTTTRAKPSNFSWTCSFFDGERRIRSSEDNLQI